MGLEAAHDLEERAALRARGRAEEGWVGSFSFCCLETPPATPAGPQSQSSEAVPTDPKIGTGFAILFLSVGVPQQGRIQHLPKFMRLLL